MRKYVLFMSLWCGLVVAGPDPSIDASWTRVGLSSYAVWSISIAEDDPKMLYAATSAGVFVTLNGGRTWMPFSQGIMSDTDRDLRWIVVASDNSDVVYVGGKGGAFKSSNGGDWVRMNVPVVAGSTSQLTVDEIAVDPSNSDHLFVAGSGKLLQSTDGGMSFEQISGVNAWTVSISSADPNTIFAGRFDDIYRSSDAGSTWERSAIADLISISANSVYLRRIEVDPADANRVYLYTLQGNPRLSISDDGGASFPIQYAHTLGYPSSDIRDMIIDPVDSSRVITTGSAYGISGTFQSLDSGETWSELVPGAPVNYNFQQLAIAAQALPDERLFGANNVVGTGGVWVLAEDLMMFATFESDN